MYGLWSLWQKDVQKISLQDSTIALASFNDALEGGHSEVENHSDSSIHFSTTLRKGAPFPYAGIGLYRTTLSFFVLADTKWEMTVRVGKKQSIPITLLVVPQSKLSPLPDTILLQTVVYAQAGTHSYRFPVSDFKLPEWWLVKHQKKTSDFSLIDLNKVAVISFQSGPHQQIDKRSTVEITELTIRPDFWPVQQAFLIGCPVYYLLLFLLPFHKRRKERIHYVPIYPQQNSTSEDPLEKIKHVMAAQFYVADLTVEMVAAESGVPAYRIPQLLQEHMGLNFKKLLNTIRLEESKRLLQNPQLRISEIAYRVGYQHVQHFNRIFKDATSQTPKEFRQYFLSEASEAIAQKR